jgi:Family of unknown function (DUF6455)
MPHTEMALANPGLIGRMLDWVRAHAGPGTDLAAFSREDLRNMADDLAIASGDMLAMSWSARDNTVLMERMMRARGLDPERMRHSFVMLLRDVERVCTQCKATGRCRRELDGGTAAAHCHDYCLNAATFDDLIECAGVPMFP